jgi:ATP-dependent DNA ligase
LEGVVAKKSDGHYAPGRRDWVKVKRHRTVDCAVIGLAGDAVSQPWFSGSGMQTVSCTT